MKEYCGVGIDLTQHVPLVCAAHLEITSQQRTLAAAHWPPQVELVRKFIPRPPSALLPIVRGEPLLVGDQAAVHRRSAGLPWPPEAQAPFGGASDAGVARIPLAAAWSALLPDLGAASMSRRDDPTFSWAPDHSEHSASSGDILAKSIRLYLDKAGVFTENMIVAVVVPDLLDEGGQEILLDSLEQVGFSRELVHLVSRPVAVAVEWCSTQLQTSHEARPGVRDGSAIGRLRVWTQPLDGWEATSIEVRSQDIEGRRWLIPVYERAERHEASADFNISGLPISLALAQVVAQEEFGPWHCVLSTDWLTNALCNGGAIHSLGSGFFERVHSSDNLNLLRDRLSSLPPTALLLARVGVSGQPPINLAKSLWESQERASRKGLPILAEVAAGAFAPLCAEAIESSNDPAPGISSQQISAARGAAIVASAIAKGLPCYRESLLPLDLYVRGVDEYGDPKPSWTSLVGAESVGAGLPWKSPEAITGFAISELQDHLLLPLRRSISGTDVFRQVSTTLTKPADKNEPVSIRVEVRPGQGFARVSVTSVTPGVFDARLDWRTMKPCEQPTPPPLAYFPGVSRVVSDPRMFGDAESAMHGVLTALKKPNSDATEALRDLIQKLNKWPLAHYVERTRGRSIAKDFMLYYGVLGSDGNTEKLKKPALIQELQKALQRAFQRLEERNELRTSLGKQVLRTAGWLYLGMPEACYSYIRARLSTSRYSTRDITSEELHCIGASFEQHEDLQIFYPLLLSALKQGHAINNWLRALRNICRFRNHSLHPQAISDKTIVDLVEGIFKTIRAETQRRNFGRILTNCLETFPFLLKRRRYDSYFLAPQSPLSVNIIKYLEEFDTKYRSHLPNKYRAMPQATLNFLRMNATSSDLEQLLGVEDEEDA